MTQRKTGMTQRKWISDLTIDLPVADAARRVLTFRLEAVRDCLGEALREEGNLVNSIHQLRIATRRASAAVAVFASCLPLKVARTAKRQLRGIRRAAGEARDWDVLVARLVDGAEATSGNDRAGVDLMVGYAMAHRVPAQRQLEASSPNYPFGFERFMAETVGTIREPRSGEASLIEFARPMLAHLANALDHSLIERQATDYERLHDVRLAGKRLRYALEIFVDCFGPSLRQVVCPALADLQQILGEVNDHCTAGQRYSALERGMQRCLSSGNGRYAPWLSRQIHQHSERMVAAGQQFAVWRERWQSVETRTALADIQPPVALRRLPELSMPIRFDGAPSASVAFVATPVMESIA